MKARLRPSGSMPKAEAGATRRRSTAVAVIVEVGVRLRGGLFEVALL